MMEGISCRQLQSKQFFCGFIIQYLAGIAVDPFLDSSDGGMGILANIASFRNESAYDAVGILVGAAFQKLQL